MRIHSTIQGRNKSGRSAGFTITEMLVTIGVIVILASILVTALGKASRAAQRGKTEFLMQTIKSGVETFRADHGYIPQVLGVYGTDEGQMGYGRDLNGSMSDLSTASVGDQQAYYSMTSLPEFLLGYDDRRMDGYGYVAQGSALLPPDDSLPGYREHPALGIRSPGPDGVWNATFNARMGAGSDPFLFVNRNPNNLGSLSLSNNAQITGKVYGPYIDLKDGTSIGELAGISYANTDQGTTQTVERVLLPGDDGFGDGTNPKAFLDYWGNPIRYYRRPPRHISTPEKNAKGWTLANIIALRPSVYEEGISADGYWEDANNDGSTSRALLSAEYAFFSNGADRNSSPFHRVDDGPGLPGRNRDNIVEVGP